MFGAKKGENILNTLLECLDKSEPTNVKTISKLTAQLSSYIDKKANISIENTFPISDKIDSCVVSYSNSFLKKSKYISLVKSVCDKLFEIVKSRSEHIIVANMADPIYQLMDSLLKISFHIAMTYGRRRQKKLSQPGQPETKEKREIYMSIDDCIISLIIPIAFFVESIEIVRSDTNNCRRETIHTKLEFVGGLSRIPDTKLKTYPLLVLEHFNRKSIQPRDLLLICICARSQCKHFISISLLFRKILDMPLIFQIDRKQ